MEQQHLQLLAKTLDDIKHQNGVEYWFARELFSILGYSRWDSFEPVLRRAKDACSNSGESIPNHFQDLTRMVEIGSEAQRPLADIKLTRYACYLITINGDPRKEQIAVAQAYFVTQTRSIEMLQKRMEELERIDAREKLKITEKDFSDMLFSRNVDGAGMGEIRAKGDSALFGGKTTEEMKQQLNVKHKQPLADYLPNVTLKAKDLATAMTIEKTRKDNLMGKQIILNEHIVNNKNVRTALVNTNIYPESLPAAEDIKKIEAKHRKETRELQKRQAKELAEASKKINKQK